MCPDSHGLFGKKKKRCVSPVAKFDNTVVKKMQLGRSSRGNVALNSRPEKPKKRLTRSLLGAAKRPKMNTGANSEKDDASKSNSETNRTRSGVSNDVTCENAHRKLWHCPSSPPGSPS